jgi:SAM-dependent methyltransferase
MEEALKSRKSRSNFATVKNTECVACGSRDAPIQIGLVYDHEYRSTEIEFSMVRCTHCGLVYLDPRPDVSELPRIYPPTYYSYHLTDNAAAEGRRTSYVQTLFHRLNLKAMRAKLTRSGISLDSHSRPVRVLDVGCGVGAQLDIFKELLPGAELHGVDIGELAVEKTKARGHTAYLGRFEEIDLPKDYFDIVYSAHVIEHVEDPKGFLEKCQLVSAPRATIIIETPNTDCIEFEALKGRHWGGYHAPRHFYLFNPKNLDTMVGGIGLKTIIAQPYPCSIFWNWTCHSILMKFAGTRIADALFPPITIFYGGIRSFVLLGSFSVLEGIILRITGRASAFWIAFSKL